MRLRFGHRVGNRLAAVELFEDCKSALDVVGTNIAKARPLHRLQLGFGQTQHQTELVGQFPSIVGLEKITVFALMHQVRQRHRVSGDDRQPRGHGLHGGDGLQFGDGWHSENGGSGERGPQLRVGQVAAEGNPVVDAEFAGHLLELVQLVAAANDFELYV